MPLLGLERFDVLATEDHKYWICNYVFSTQKTHLHIQILVFCIYTKTWSHRRNVFLRTWSPKWYKAKLRHCLWCAWGAGVAFHLGCCPTFLMPWAGCATGHESLRLQKPFQVCPHQSQRWDYGSETHTWGTVQVQTAMWLQQRAGGHKLQKTSVCGNAQVAEVQCCECLCFSPSWLWEVCSCCNLAFLSSISRGKKGICWFVGWWLSLVELSIAVISNSVKIEIWNKDDHSWLSGKHHNGTTIPFSDFLIFSLSGFTGPL